MNVKLISKALHALSLLSEEDYDLVLKLRALTEDERGMLMLVLEPSKPVVKKASKSAPRKIQHCAVCDWTKRAALHKDSTRDDYHEFVTSQPEPKPSEQKSSKPATKSERASGMAAQLKERRQEQREPMTTKDHDYGNDEQRCTVLRGDLGGTVCGLLPDHNVHHLQSSRGFHPFVPSTTAPPAPASSPANGASSATEKGTRRSAPSSMPESDDGEGRSASLSGANSEASAASAGAATGGSSE